MVGCESRHTKDLRKNGLRELAPSRRCTDLPFLALFVAFVAGMLAIGIYSLGEGDAERLIYPSDSFGNVCGRNNNRIAGLSSNNSGLDMTDYPSVYFVDPTHPEAPSLCVKTCPGAVSTCGVSLNVDHPVDSCVIGQDCPCLAHGLCLSAAGAGPYVDSISGANSFYPTRAGSNCPAYTYTSTPVVGYCFPSVLAAEVGDGAVLAADFLTSFEEIMDGAEAGTEVYKDFILVQTEFAYLMAIAVGLTLVLIVLMRWLAKVIVYTVIAGAILGMVFGTYTMWSMYEAQQEYVTSADVVNSTVVLLDEDLVAEDAYYYTSWVLTVLTVLIFVICIAMRNKIRQAIGIFQETSVGLTHNPGIFLIPIATYLLLFGFIAVWAYFTAYMYTMQEAYEDNDTGYISYRWADSQENENVTTISDFQGKPTESEFQFFLVYYVFGLLWLTQFIIAAGSFLISGTLAEWYFAGPHDRSANKDHSPHTGVLRSIWHLYRYHIGTVAFGSLIVAILHSLRLILSYIQRKFEKKVGFVGRFVMCCCKCCLWCLEKCIKYVNKNAYIECSIHGYGFCKSACAAFSSLLANILLVAAVNGIGGLLLLMLKLMVASGTAMIGYAMLWEKTGVTNSLYIILVIIGLLAYIIADAFTDLYATGIDTILLCFIEDKHYNDGSSDKPYHCSNHLQKFVHRTADKEAGGLKNPEDGCAMDTLKVTPKPAVVKGKNRGKKTAKVGPAPAEPQQQLEDM